MKNPEILTIKDLVNIITCAEKMGAEMKITILPKEGKKDKKDG